MRRLSWAGILAVVACVGLSTGAVLPTPAEGQTRQEIFRKAKTYTIKMRTTVRNAFHGDKPGTFSGAGFVADRERGLVVTNAHVTTRSPARFKVLFKGEDPVEARAVYIDPDIDVAVIKVAPETMPDWATAADLDCRAEDPAGKEVATFGHPKGLNFSATRGIVSRLAYARGRERLQIDAPINPGNSGGPLIDLETGMVVGVNSAYLKKSRGIGFAVPARFVCGILDIIRQGGNPSPPDLGLDFASHQFRDLHLFVAGGRNPDVYSKFKAGDIIVAADGVKVENPSSLAAVLRGKTGTVQFTVERAGQPVDIDVPVKPKPLVTDRRGLLIDGALFSTDIYPEREAAEGLLYIHSVKRGWPAIGAGLRKFNRLLTIDGKQAVTLDELFRHITSAGTKRKIRLVMRRLQMSKGNLYSHVVVELKHPKLQWVKY